MTTAICIDSESMCTSPKYHFLSSIQIYEHSIRRTVGSDPSNIGLSIWSRSARSANNGGVYNVGRDNVTASAKTRGELLESAVEEVHGKLATVGWGFLASKWNLIVVCGVSVDAVTMVDNCGGKSGWEGVVVA